MAATMNANNLFKNVASKTPKMWTIAIATALGSFGGFPVAPQWWQELAKTKWFQFFTLWVLVYQGGGSGELVWTTVVSVIVFVLFEVSKKIQIITQQQQQQ